MSWLALCALVFATLAPGISHALAAANGSSALWTEVCTAAGAKLVNVNDGFAAKPAAPDTGSHSGSMHFEHCPFCFTHAVGHNLPPATVTALPLLDTNYAVPSLYLHAPRPLFIWSAALARAPPAFS